MPALQALPGQSSWVKLDDAQFGTIPVIGPEPKAQKCAYPASDIVYSKCSIEVHLFLRYA